MSRDEMSALQGKRLNKLVNLVYHNVPFYRNKMQEMDLSPDDIQTIEDIVKLPLLPNRIYVIIILMDFRLLLLRNCTCTRFFGHNRESYHCGIYTS